MNRLTKLAFVAALALGACATNTPSSSNNPPAPGAPFQTLTGADAHRFAVATDLVLVGSHDTKRGRTYERYQQMYGEAKVVGGQTTIHRGNRSGLPELVLGAHHKDIEASNQVLLSEADAIAIAGNALPLATDFQADLMIDPVTGRYHYDVETRGDALRYFMWVDAETGAVINEYDGITSGCDWNGGNPGGLGFRQEQIDLTNLVSGDASSGYTLDSGRQVTRDLGSQKKPFYGSADADADGCYDQIDRQSPGQGALVSAHVNVAAADQYYLGRGFDMGAELGTNQLIVWAHKDVNYVNAYWDGTKMVFGDGDGSTFSELVSLDIAAHEFTHGVTDFTSDLIYQNESGALNESFSDIMGAVIEFQKEPESSDWLMGEDVMTNGAGLRNMADPTTHGDPGSYCDRYTGTSDNGGVHSNSGISNKAFYLVATSGIGIDAAADIFFTGFTGLTASATFLDARAATEGAATDIDAANALAGTPTNYLAAVQAGWDGVEVGSDVVCDSGPTCTATEATETSCGDGVDNDCDGLIDAADADCSSGTCELGQVGDSCSSDSDCCSSTCKGKPGNRTCK